MTVDVDDVNEKLNGLVSLLQVVGIDGVDPDALIEEQKRLVASQKRDGSSAGTGTTAQSTDSQILEIIKKLHQAQADSPEILAALQSPELRALASLAAQKQSAAAQSAPPSLDDVMEDDDDNYPKIGPGYSDEISVVSDLSTPTVMTKQSVAEEEHYRDVNGGARALPPMHVGIGGRPPTSVGGGGKSRNMLANVSAASAKLAIAKTGGAAAQRRMIHQQQMARLQEEGEDDYDIKKRQNSPTRQHSEDRKKGKSKKKDGEKKKKKKSGDHDDKSKNSKTSSKGDEIDWGTSGDDSAWPSFDKFEANFGEDPFGSTKSPTENVIDSDGFFTSDVFANVDPFAAQSGSASASGSKSSGKKKKKRIVKDDGQGTKSKGEKVKDKKGRRTRRASMDM